MAEIRADVDYVQGHLRYGHFEMELFGKELEDFKKLSEEEKLISLKEGGELVVDDYSVNDYGDLSNLSINE